MRKMTHQTWFNLVNDQIESSNRLFPALAEWEIDFAIKEARPEGNLARIPISATGPYCAAEQYIMTHHPSKQ